MDKNAYKEKLKGFNSTPKYKAEVDFLLKLMQPKSGEKILDYGCGLGNLVRKIRDEHKVDCFGYDVNNYREIEDEFLFRSSYFFKFDKVYFNHSIAHVPNIDQKLEDLKALLNPEAKIYIITPNKDWVLYGRKANYTPDPTVVGHFSLYELRNLLFTTGFNTLTLGQFGDMEPTAGAEVVNERLFIEAQWNGK